MRCVLVDHARARRAGKRGGDQGRILLTDAVALFEERSTDLVDLDEKLQELAGFDEQKARVVDLRFFGGLTVEEIAKVIGVSRATVERDWAMARAWLHQHLRKG